MLDKSCLSYLPTSIKWVDLELKKNRRCVVRITIKIKCYLPKCNALDIIFV